MKRYIEERAVEIAHYIINNNATVRQAAKAFGVSKSTVHTDICSRLLFVNSSLAKDVRKVLDVIKKNATSEAGWQQKKSIFI